MSTPFERIEARRLARVEALRLIVMGGAFERGDYITPTGEVWVHLRAAGWNPRDGNSGYVKEMEALGFERVSHNSRAFWKGIRPSGPTVNVCPLCGAPRGAE
jgi:hypothetical protein